MSIAWTPCPTDRDFLIGEPGGYAIVIRHPGKSVLGYIRARRYVVRRYVSDERWELLDIARKLDQAKTAAEAHYAKWGRKAAR